MKRLYIEQAEAETKYNLMKMGYKKPKFYSDCSDEYRLRMAFENLKYAQANLAMLRLGIKPPRNERFDNEAQRQVFEAHVCGFDYEIMSTKGGFLLWKKKSSKKSLFNSADLGDKLISQEDIDRLRKK